MHKQVIAVTCFPPSFKGKGSAVAEGVGCSQAAWEQLLHSGTSRSLDLEYQNKKKTQSQLSEQIKDRCVPPLRGWIWALSLLLLDGGVHRRVSGLLSLQQDPANNWVLLLHPICCSATLFLSIALCSAHSSLHLYHIPLSQSIFLHEKRTVYFLSLGVHPTSTLAETEGWGCGVWKIAFVMLAYPHLTKNSQFISLATMNRLCEH